MSKNRVLTGKPSVDRPWMQYYPEEVNQMVVPDCSLFEYLKSNCPGMDVVAMHYYGTDITWKTFFKEVEAAARALKAMGLGTNDQIPVFLRSVPEFIFLLLAAEKIGASLLCRDNTLAENVEAVQKSKAKVIIAHDFLSKKEMDTYLNETAVEKIVLLSPLHFGNRDDMPEHVQAFTDAQYPKECASGPATITWDEFIAQGEGYRGRVKSPTNINRPLFRAYTSGSTGPSKQVIHSAHSMIGIIYQMSLYGASGDFRPTWLVTHLPPCLVAVVVSMILSPLASNKLLILDPFCDVQDLDLEMMRYRPNIWPLIPMFIEVIMRNGRIPDDYDMSHLLSAGAGCEGFNNNQIERTQKFLYDHNCKAMFSAGYGSSEAGSNISLPCFQYKMGNGNVGIPMPMTTLSIFKPGTQEELTYNQLGEICKAGPGNMLGYDNKKATAKALQTHEDGQVWLHTGDIGYINEDGVVYALTRGDSKRYGGGDLASLPMENLVADAAIEGIDDEFFVIIPDEAHPGYFLPYLYVVLHDGYTVDNIKDKVKECLEPHMYPVEIIQLEERPFFHYKTNRIGLTSELIAAKK